MGTDIHLYVERKLRDEWVLVDPIPPFRRGPEKNPTEMLADCAKEFEDVVPERANLWRIMRYYTLFTRLAGVRKSNSLPTPTIKGVQFGIPDDISVMLKALYEVQLDGMHSAAFCTLLDLVSRNHEEEPEFVSMHLNELTDALSRLKQDYGLQDNQVRIVYWFDD